MGCRQPIPYHTTSLMWHLTLYTNPQVTRGAAGGAATGGVLCSSRQQQAPAPAPAAAAEEAYLPDEDMTDMAGGGEGGRGSDSKPARKRPRAAPAATPPPAATKKRGRAARRAGGADKSSSEEPSGAVPVQDGSDDAEAEEGVSPFSAERVVATRETLSARRRAAAAAAMATDASEDTDFKQMTVSQLLHRRASLHWLRSAVPILARLLHRLWQGLCHSMVAQ